MCLECGISVYVEPLGMLVDDLGPTEMKVVRNTFCKECGGQLALIGKAGDEPYYRVQT
jgi:hypothetical protein